ncbi:hypothetical protein [Pseudomonas fluorescens]|uniref:hypothetical protein n=1 Tax=Pseudomonas fluorescens TaxID=294 RepID=UPI001EF0B208|nr:hypothetical protein [Pseudomonas fluorescens]
MRQVAYGVVNHREVEIIHHQRLGLEALAVAVVKVLGERQVPLRFRVVVDLAVMLMGPVLDVLGADLPEHGIQVAVPADQVEIRGAIVRAPTKLENRQQLAVFRADYVVGDVVLIG